MTPANDLKTLLKMPKDLRVVTATTIRLQSTGGLWLEQARFSASNARLMELESANQDTKKLTATIRRVAIINSIECVCKSEHDMTRIEACSTHMTFDEY